MRQPHQFFSLLNSVLERAGIAYARGLLTEQEAETEAAPSRLRLRELEALETCAGPIRMDAVEASQKLAEAMTHLDSLEGKRGFLRLFGIRVQIGPQGVVGVRLRM